MNTTQWYKVADAARTLRRELHAERRLRRAIARRHAWAAHGPQGDRNPFWMGFGGAFLGLLAFVLVMTLLGALFALLGLVLKVALAIGVAWFVLRVLHHWPRPGTEVMVVPPEARSYPYRRRS